MRLWRWVVAAWATAVVCGTAWTALAGFPWDQRESPLMQLAGVALIYALQAVPFLIAGSLIALGLELALNRLWRAGSGLAHGARVIAISAAAGAHAARR